MARNGYLAEDGIRLVAAEDDDLLIATAAAAYQAMKAAAAREGVTLYIVEPAGAYRRFGVQADMKRNPSRYNLNPKMAVGLAAAGASTHGWGDRADFNMGALPWLLANAWKFGWTREFGDADPNHFQHDGKTATGGGASGVKPTTPSGQREDINMLQAYIPGSGGKDHTFILFGPGFYWEYQDTLPTRGIATQALGQISGLPTSEVAKGAASSIKVTRAQADDIRKASIGR